MIDALLILAELAVWIGCVGFARLGSAFDRLHCATFVALSAGPLLAIAAFWSDGASDRAFKILLVIILLAVNGAVTGHAVARAIAWREGANETT